MCRTTFCGSTKEVRRVSTFANGGDEEVGEVDSDVKGGEGGRFVGELKGKVDPT